MRRKRAAVNPEMKRVGELIGAIDSAAEQNWEAICSRDFGLAGPARKRNGSRPGEEEEDRHCGGH